MSGTRKRIGLLALAVITVAAVAAGMAVAPEQSGAQAGSMHSCPPAGKWSIAVWEGASGAAASDAFAVCGADAVSAAYSLDPQTGAWSRWFAGKPDVSNLPPLTDKQGVLALGSAQVQTTPVPGLPNPATAYCVELGYEWRIVENPEGQAGMCVFPDGTECDEWSFFEGECGQSWAPESDGAIHNCPPAGKWSIAVWDGATGTAASDALATCGADAVAAAYSLDSATGAWSRWFAGKPDVSNLAPLGEMQGVLALGAGTPYTGETSQGLLMEFDVTADGLGVGRVKFGFEGLLNGEPCQGLMNMTFGQAQTIVDNAFTINDTDYTLTGRFDSATTAVGELQVHIPDRWADPGCFSDPLTWTASVQ